MARIPLVSEYQRPTVEEMTMGDHRIRELVAAAEARDWMATHGPSWRQRAMRAVARLPRRLAAWVEDI